MAQRTEAEMLRSERQKRVARGRLAQDIGNQNPGKDFYGMYRAGAMHPRLAGATGEFPDDVFLRADRFSAVSNAKPWQRTRFYNQKFATNGFRYGAAGALGFTAVGAAGRLMDRIQSRDYTSAALNAGIAGAAGYGAYVAYSGGAAYTRASRQLARGLARGARWLG